MSRCALCPRVRPPVHPTGPSPCRILFLGEAPSFTEDRDGMPFCGKTGWELTQTYFPIALLHRDGVYIDNVCRCSKWDYDNPTPQEAMACASMHLGPTLAQVQPQIIVPMGAVACSVFPEIGNLNLQHGIPVPGKWGGWTGILFPMYHPSAGIHSTGYMIPLMQDFDRLGKLLKELDGISK